MQVLDVTEKKCQVRLFLKKRSEYLLEDLWEEKKVQGLVRSQPALIYLSNIFPKLLFLCVCRFDRGSFCFISWFCLKTRSRVQRPDQRWSLSALHTQPSVSWWLMSDLAQVDFQFKCQISDESFCCKMLFSVAIVWKWIIMNNGIMTSDRTRTWNDFLSWTLLLFLHRCCFRIPPLHCGITQSSFFGVIETLEGRTGCW